MSPDGAVLERYGYPPPHAAFVAFVARHSGYFVLRHWREFLAPADRAGLADLLQRMLTRRHAVTVDLDADTRVYHLTARTLYAALGEGDSRHRRAHAVCTIEQRLMSMDVLLGHRSYRALAGERDTVRFFVEEHRVPRGCLPATRYRPVSNPTQETVRHFAGVGPIVVGPDSVIFTYLDARDSQLGRFRQFLTRYEPLWRRVPLPVTVRFVTSDIEQGTRAQAVFARCIRSVGAPDLPTLRLACEARRRLERYPLAGLDQRELDRLRDAARLVMQPPHASCYEAWQRLGDEIWQARPSADGLDRIDFDVWRTPHRYGATRALWARG